MKPTRYLTTIMAAFLAIAFFATFVPAQKLSYFEKRFVTEESLRLPRTFLRQGLEIS
jgi:hypothetical protein